MANPFAGRWHGDWHGRQQNSSGSWELVVDETGETTGKSWDSRKKPVAELSGHVTEQGRFTYQYQFGREIYSGEADMRIRSDGTVEVNWQDSNGTRRIDHGSDVLTRL